MDPVTGWQVVGWALVLGVAVIPLLTGIGVGLAIARALWIAATLGALPSGGDDADA